MKIVSIALLISAFLGASQVYGEAPEIWASMPERHIPNRTPAGGVNYGVTILMTVFNPSSQPMDFDFYDTLTIRVLDAKKREVTDEYRADTFIKPTPSDLMEIDPHFSYSRAYNLMVQNGALSMADGAGGVHKFTLRKPGEYTVVLAFGSNYENPAVIEFERNGHESLVSRIYRGPMKLGSFKIQVTDLNKPR